MIKRYKDYKNEIDFLESCGVTKYTFNYETNLIDVYQDIRIVDGSIKTINYENLSKIKFGKIYGNFFCHSTGIKNLSNFPKEVTGNFNCNENKLLSSLEGCPSVVGGIFNCYGNNLTSLKGCPKKINDISSFCCTHNELTSLEGCPSYVGGNFECGYNKLKNIESYPLCIIQGDIDCSFFHFREILKVVQENEEIFENLLDNKIKFHQMVMRLNPRLIPFYETILPPSKNSNLLI